MNSKLIKIFNRMKKFNVNQSEVESVGEDMNNSSIYLPECDLNGVPLLRRVEKYPDLPEDDLYL